VIDSPVALPSPLADDEVVLAVDVGGTTLKGAAVGRSGEIVTRLTSPTFGVHGKALDGLLRLAETLRGSARELGYRATRVGVASPGHVEPASGTVVFAANLQWKDIELKRILEASLGLPVAVEHDARAGAIAERNASGAEGLDNFLFVPIGTGVSAAVVTGGSLVLGASGASGEFGHVPVIPDGELCTCGGRGCVEAYASGTTILTRYLRNGGTRATSAREIALSLDSDPVAASVWDDAVGALAAGLAGMIAVLDPATIVIGGGLSQAGDALLVPLRRSVQSRLSWRTAPAIVQSALGAQGGMVGAAILGWGGSAIEAGFGRNVSTASTPA